MSLSSAAALSRLAANTSWLLAERAISITAAVGVGLYFARYLGPENYGLYSYALGLFGIFATISKLGINPLVIGEAVEAPGSQASILGSAFALRMAASLICVVLLNLAAWLVVDEPVVRHLTLILSAAILFAPFETITHWFEASVSMKPVAIARSAAALLGATAKLVMILSGFALVTFAWLVPAEALILAALLIAIYYRRGFRVTDWKQDAVFIGRLAREGAPLFLSTLAVMTYMKIDQVMLGAMSSAREVGYYGAAVKISEMFYFLPVLVSGLLFPYLIKFERRSESDFRQAFQLMCDGLAWMALAIAIPITVLATPIIHLAYGDSYLPSARILVIHVWAGLFVFVEAMRSKWFVIRQVTRFQFMTTAIGAILNIGLNLYLIPKYQGLGAAMATLGSYGIAVVFSCFLYKDTREVGTILTKAIFAPLRVVQTLKTLRAIRASVDGGHS
jgi:O-antigen/teichoic acid export membrane protein